MKKTLLTLAAASLMLAACGGSKAEMKQDEPVTTTEPAPAEAAPAAAEGAAPADGAAATPAPQR